MAEVQQARVQDQELLRVLELLVQALEQVVRVSALEMEQVRAEVEALAQAVGLVPEKAPVPVLAVVPDLVEVSEQAKVLARAAAQELVEAEARVEVLEPESGLVQVQLPGW